MDEVIVRSILGAVEQGALVDREAALIGEAVADLEAERQAVGGEQAARMPRSLDQPVAGLGIGDGRAVQARRARIGEAEIGDALPDLAVEKGVIGEDRPAWRYVAAGAERQSVDSRAAVEHLRIGRGRVVRRHPEIAPLVAEQGGGDLKPALEQIGLGADLDSFAPVSGATSQKLTKVAPEPLVQPRRTVADDGVRELAAAT